MEPEPFGWVIGGVEFFFLGMGKEEQRRHEGVWACQRPTLLQYRPTLLLLFKEKATDLQMGLLDSLLVHGLRFR